MLLYLLTRSVISVERADALPHSHALQPVVNHADDSVWSVGLLTTTSDGLALIE